MAVSREDFDTESGLLTDYEGEVVDSWFAVDDKFGNTQLFLKQSTDSATVPEITERFSVGGSWKSFDGGKTVENQENPDKTKIHESSRYGLLIRRCSDTVDKGGLDMLDTFIERGHSPREAAMWLGLRFSWAQFEKPYTMKQEDGTKTEGISKFNLPVAFLGAEGNPTSGGSTSSDQASAPSTALDGLSDELVAQLKETRQAASSHGEFVDKAIGLTGVLGNDTLVKAIADENILWKELA